MLVWIEDEQDLIGLFEDYLEYIGVKDFKVYENFEKASINDGDLVIHGILGVGENKHKAKNVTYLTCSGEMGERHVDLRKPFQLDDIKELLKNYIELEEE